MEAGAVFRLKHVAQPQPADLHLGRLGGAGMGIIGFKPALIVAAFGRRISGDLHRAGLAHRQHQIDDGIARRLRQIQRHRLIRLPRQGEGSAILKHTTRIGQRELPGGQQVAVDGEFRQPPAIRAQ